MEEYRIKRNEIEKVDRNKVKEYWAYKDHVAKNYKTSITQVGDDLVIYEIRWKDDNALYARFEIKKEYDDIFEDSMYYVYLVDGDTRELINEELEFIDSFTECIISCTYYFYSRF